MTKVGSVMCLIALACTGGGLSNSTTSSKMQLLTPKDTSALARTYHDASVRWKRGEYQNAADLYLAGLREARRRHEPELEAHFAWGLGSCYFAQRRYQEALDEYLHARDALERLGQAGFVRALNGNIGSLYSQLGEIDAAIDAMRRAEVPAGENDPALEFTASRIGRLVTLATLLAKNGRMEEAREVFRRAILAADRIDDPELLSNAWDRLGGELLSRGELAQAEDALLEAFRIRKLRHLPSLAGSYGKLGLLRVEQGDFRSASRLLDAAVAESKSKRVRIPGWLFYHSRGRLRLSEGNLRRAHADFGLALELARNYRLTTPPTDSTRVSLEGVLQPVYASYVQTGTRLYFESGGGELARETFAALEENRGSSLSARLGERRQFLRGLRPAYWDALAALQSVESAALFDDSDGPRQSMRRLRGDILEMEARAGVPGFRNPANLLRRLQLRLDGDTALLSFHLGDAGSGLWAVSRSDFALYPLPARLRVLEAARRFRAAVMTHDSSSERLGRELYATLFGGLGAEYRNKTRWLLSLDEGLFETPFAALVTGGVGAPVYLIERHSIRIVSGAANLLEAPTRRGAPHTFAGIGDAIYNAADIRWRGRTEWPWRPRAPATLGLSRLAGSGPEIESCAREWPGGAVLLQGGEVTRTNVRLVAEGGASVMHFATHIVQDPQQKATGALISLSLNDTGSDELLGASEITGWNVTASLVALSGCNSGAGVARPGAGLMGLTRAWLMAGAGAVVATGWSIPDDAGDFFRSFYRELQRLKSRDPGDALRAAQIESVRSGGWRSDPGYWAAFFALGNR